MNIPIKYSQISQKKTIIPITMGLSLQSHQTKAVLDNETMASIKVPVLEAGPRQPQLVSIRMARPSSSRYAFFSTATTLLIRFLARNLFSCVRAVAHKGRGFTRFQNSISTLCTYIIAPLQSVKQLTYQRFLQKQNRAILLSAVLLAAVVSATGLLLPASPDRNAIIKNAIVKQPSPAVVGQPVSYTMLIKKSAIREGQYLAVIPKGAVNVTVSYISATEAAAIAARETSTTQDSKTLTLTSPSSHKPAAALPPATRLAALARFVALRLPASVSGFFSLQSLPRSLTATESLMVTKTAKLVDLSVHIPQPSLGQHLADSIYVRAEEDATPSASEPTPAPEPTPEPAPETEAPETEQLPSDPSTPTPTDTPTADQTTADPQDNTQQLPSQGQ